MNVSDATWMKQLQALLENWWQFWRWHGGGNQHLLQEKLARSCLCSACYWLFSCGSLCAIGDEKNAERLTLVKSIDPTSTVETFCIRARMRIKGLAILWFFGVCGTCGWQSEYRCQLNVQLKCQMLFWFVAFQVGPSLRMRSSTFSVVAATHCSRTGC